MYTQGTAPLITSVVTCTLTCIDVLLVRRTSVSLTPVHFLEVFFLLHNFNSNRMSSGRRSSGPAAPVGQQAPPARRGRGGSARLVVGDSLSPSGRAAIPRAAVPPPAAASPRQDAPPVAAGGAADTEQDQGADDSSFEEAAEGDVLDVDHDVNIVGRKSVSRRTALRVKTFVRPFEVDPSAVSCSKCN